MPYKCKKTSLSCTIFYHFSPLWNVLYVINSYKRSIAAFDDVCLRVYWMDWMFTQPLNYDFFTVPFLIWHPLSFPQQSIISSMAISESQRTEMRPGRAFTSSFSSSREVIFLFLVMMLLSSLLKTVSWKLWKIVQLSVYGFRVLSRWFSKCSPL